MFNLVQTTFDRIHICESESLPRKLDFTSEYYDCKVQVQLNLCVSQNHMAQEGSQYVFNTAQIWNCTLECHFEV